MNMKYNTDLVLSLRSCDIPQLGWSPNSTDLLILLLHLLLSSGPCLHSDATLQLSASEWINLVFKYSCRRHKKSLFSKEKEVFFVTFFKMESELWKQIYSTEKPITCQKPEKSFFFSFWQMGFFVPLIYIRQQFIFFLCRRPMGSIIVLVRSACSRESRKFVILSVLLFSKSSTTTQLLISIFEKRFGAQD